MCVLLKYFLGEDLHANNGGQHWQSLITKTNVKKKKKNILVPQPNYLHKCPPGKTKKKQYQSCNKPFGRSVDWESSCGMGSHA